MSVLSFIQYFSAVDDHNAPIIGTDLLARQVVDVTIPSVRLPQSEDARLCQCAMAQGRAHGIPGRFFVLDTPDHHTRTVVMVQHDVGDDTMNATPDNGRE